MRARSLLFNIVFYVIPASYLIFGLPMLLASRQQVNRVIYGGISRNLLKALKAIVGLDREVRGLENLPRGPVIIAVKHQSAWDVFGLTTCFDETAMILKSELMYIPLLGWFAKKMEMIPVQRGKRSAAIKSLLRASKKCAGDKREIFIFPEGNRKAPGAPPAYKRGIVAMYRSLKVPVVPVALNSGLYWRRREFMRHPGKVIVEFLPPIEPGLDDKAFMKALEGAIEPACDRLIKEALASSSPPPTPEGY